MDKRLLFRYHQHGAMGGRRRVDASGPSGHGPCPVVASPAGGKSPVGGEDGTKGSVVLSGVVEPTLPRKASKC
jgi:hypothetical protein